MSLWKKMFGGSREKQPSLQAKPSTPLAASKPVLQPPKAKEPVATWSNLETTSQDEAIRFLFDTALPSARIISEEVATKEFRIAVNAWAASNRAAIVTFLPELEVQVTEFAKQWVARYGVNKYEVEKLHDGIQFTIISIKDDRMQVAGPVFWRTSAGYITSLAPRTSNM